eukprot:COSAG01_NODE_32460_length_581_cov_0.487552_1_plen_66_part_10
MVWLYAHEPTRASETHTLSLPRAPPELDTKPATLTPPHGLALGIPALGRARTGATASRSAAASTSA